jgi:hypothetical protein
MSTKKEQEPTYSKEQFLASNRFTGAQKDVLNALLVNGESYSNAKVIEMINEFLEMEVK